MDLRDGEGNPVDPDTIDPGSPQASIMTHQSPAPLPPILQRLQGMPSWTDRLKEYEENYPLHDPTTGKLNINPPGKIQAAIDLFGGLAGSTIPAVSLGGRLGQATGGIKFWHASPHDFDTFDISKVGTGQGAQSYGHGIYGAQSKEVRDQYLAEFMGRFGKAKQYRVQANVDPDHFLDWDKPFEEQSPHVQKIMKYLHPDAGEVDGEPITGEEFHSWVSGHHQMAIEDDPALIKQLTGNEGLPPSGWNTKAQLLIEREAQKRASQELLEAGIPGIRYLDGRSREAFQTMQQLEDKIAKVQQGQLASKADAIPDTSGNARAGDPMYAQKELFRLNAAKDRLTSTHYPLTYNHVFFDDKYLKIISKLGLAGLMADGYKHFSTTPVDEDPFQ